MIDLKSFREENNIKQSEICKILGIAQSYVSAIESRRRPLNEEKFKLLYKHYGDIILKYKQPDNVIIIKSNKTEPDTQIITKCVSFVNQYAYTGYLAGYQDQEYIDQLPIIPFDSEDDPNSRYMAFEMKGNSMDDGSRDSYIEGDKLFCQEIPLHMWDTSKLHTMNWNFVIVYKKGIIVRKIIDHDIQNRTIVAHPLNPFINDELINLVDVYQIFHVLEYLRKN